MLNVSSQAEVNQSAPAVTHFIILLNEAGDAPVCALTGEETSNGASEVTVQG